MRRLRRSFVLAGLAAGLSVGVGTSIGQQPAVKPAQPASGPQPVAYLYGNTPVTTEEFGKFLMDRGGAEKLETYVNIRIIEAEAAKRNITVTKIEIEAALADDLAGLSAGGPVRKEDFIKVVLPKYGKTYYEWMEDVIRPRLLLTKMCLGRVKVSEENLKVEFERQYGEKRQCQMLMWPLGDDPKEVAKRYANACKGQNEFDSEARNMVNPALKSTLGHMKPISRHLVAEDKKVEDTAFALKEGQVSEMIKTSQGYIVLKLQKIHPADSTVKFADVRPQLEKAAFDELLSKEIPACFTELKKAANPTMHYVAPSDWKTGGSFLDSVPDIIRSVGNTQPAAPATPNTPVDKTPAKLPPAK